VPEGLTGRFDLRLKYDIKPFDLEVAEGEMSL
jgi:hypothetical protein